MERTAVMGVMAAMVHQDQQDHQDQQERQDHRGHKASQDHKGSQSPLPSLSSTPSHTSHKRLHQESRSPLTQSLSRQNPATTRSHILSSIAIRVNSLSTSTAHPRLILPLERPTHPPIYPQPLFCLLTSPQLALNLSATRPRPSGLDTPQGATSALLLRWFI